MFDIGWTELLHIGIIALIAVAPRYCGFGVGP
jgi:hypothetical protein